MHNEFTFVTTFRVPVDFRCVFMAVFSTGLFKGHTLGDSRSLAAISAMCFAPPIYPATSQLGALRPVLFTRVHQKSKGVFEQSSANLALDKSCLHIPHLGVASWRRLLLCKVHISDSSSVAMNFNLMVVLPRNPLKIEARSFGLHFASMM